MNILVQYILLVVLRGKMCAIDALHSESWQVCPLLVRSSLHSIAGLLSVDTLLPARPSGAQVFFYYDLLRHGKVLPRQLVPFSDINYNLSISFLIVQISSKIPDISPIYAQKSTINPL